MDLHLFSIGYQERTSEELIAVLRTAGVTLVVDVREIAWSRKRGFSKAALESALAAAGIGYFHAKFAGNPRSIRAAAKSHDDSLTRYEQYLQTRPDVLAELDALLQAQPSSRRSICLLCYERHPADCHRLILVRHWRLAMERCVAVTHLGIDGAKRLTTRCIVTSGRDAGDTTCPRSRRCAAG